MSEQRVCKYCGAVFSRGPAEHQGRWDVRQFCSTVCWQQSRKGKERFDNRRRTIKTCQYCGKEFETGGRAGRAIRRFCSRRCAAILKNKGGILGRKLSGSGYAGHPEAKLGYIVEHRVMAGKALGRPLKPSEEVHHIDGVKQHNVKSNFLVCSKSYHRLLHNLMATIYQLERFAGQAHAVAVANAKAMMLGLDPASALE